jgi:hypothetical protein
MLYNELLPQTALNSKTPLDAMNMWYASHPQIFLHPPESNRPGCDIYSSGFKAPHSNKSARLCQADCALLF